MKVNTLAKSSVLEMEHFTYLGSVVSSTGCTVQDVKAYLSQVFDTLWESKVIGRTTKIKLCESCDILHM